MISDSLLVKSPQFGRMDSADKHPQQQGINSDFEKVPYTSPSCKNAVVYNTLFNQLIQNSCTLLFESIPD